MSTVPEEYYSQETLLPSPILLEAKVVHGFKRGSKELGFPTANLDMMELGQIASDLSTGIYFGWAQLRGCLYGAVVSVGWNPYYKNDKKTIEAYLLSKLEDFYDETLTVLLCGYLRDERGFSSLDDLIACIHEDVRRSQVHLDGDAAAFKDSNSWKA